MAPAEAKKPFVFSSADGYALCRRILRPIVSYDPHDYQLEGICKALDGVDVFAILPTGSGKTGLLSMYLLVIRAIVRDPSLCPTATKFPKNPAMLVVCPTNYIEHQIEATMQKLGLVVMVINADTISEARLHHVDLWQRAQDDVTVSMHIMSPEQLSSKGFETLVKDDQYLGRVCALGVDEAHMIYTWGAVFRKPFRQIGFARARLLDTLVIIAITATMRKGTPLQTVCEALGFREGQFHLLRRSNMRYDIQIIFREVQSPIGGLKFPELDWILHGKRKTFVFARTINLCFRLFTYLYRLDTRNPNVHKRIRIYNALNWPSYNAETRELMEKDPECNVVVGTSSLSVGVDIQGVQDVVIFGDPEDEDDRVQKFGRIRRRLDGIVSDDRCRGIVYFGSKARDRAKKALEAGVQEVASKKKSSGGAEGMDRSIAEQILARCHVNEQNRQYDNPACEPSCLCRTCAEHPPTPRHPVCDCSGCSPESPSSLKTNPVTVPPQVSPLSHIPKKLRISKRMRAAGTARLMELRLQIWENMEETKYGLLPPAIFLPDDDIKTILDHFNILDNLEAVCQVVAHNKFLYSSRGLLYDVLCALRPDFDAIKQEDKVRRAAKAKETRDAKKQAVAIANKDRNRGGVSESSGEDTSSDEDEDADNKLDSAAVTNGTTGIKWRVDPTNLKVYVNLNSPYQTVDPEQFYSK